MKAARALKKLLPFAIVVAATSLAGCYEALDNRWVQKPDSYDHWSPLMATMPLDVHGSIPGLNLDSTLLRIPDGTDVAQFQQSHPDSIGLLAQPRVEMYVGGAQLPTNASYCSLAPQLQPAPVSRGRVMVAAALCDGPRLITTASHRVPADDLTAMVMPRTVKAVESKLLFGMTVSPVQVPNEEN